MHGVYMRILAITQSIEKSTDPKVVHKCFVYSGRNHQRSFLYIVIDRIKNSLTVHNDPTGIGNRNRIWLERTKPVGFHLRTGLAIVFSCRYTGNTYTKIVSRALRHIIYSNLPIIHRSISDRSGSNADTEALLQKITLKWNTKAPPPNYRSV